MDTGWDHFTEKRSIVSGDLEGRFMRKIIEDYGQAIIYAVLGSGCIGVLWYLLGYIW